MPSLQASTHCCRTLAIRHSSSKVNRCSLWKPTEPQMVSVVLVKLSEEAVVAVTLAVNQQMDRTPQLREEEAAAAAARLLLVAVAAVV